MSSKTLRKRFIAILAVYAVLAFAMWLIYHNTVFSHIERSARESIALAERILLTNLNEEFTRMKSVSSALARSVYVQEFLAEGNVTAYYEKAEAVSEIIRKSTYPHLIADSIISITANGTGYRFTGGVSTDSIEKIYREIAGSGATSVFTVLELDGTGYFCLIDQVNLYDSGEITPVGYVVTLSNLEKMRRTTMEMDIMTGIDAAVILNDEILISNNRDMIGANVSELEKLYGSVEIAQVAGTDLFVAAAVTRDVLYYGERMFFTISFIMLLILVIAIVFLYRMLSAKMVNPMLEKAENMQMGLLKTQISAHFVVNTIDCIESLAEQGEMEKTAAAARNLGGMLRNMHESDEEINIYEQIDHVMDYIEIMNIRNNDKFEISIEMDDLLVEYLMPGQILQPLVENALTHGLGNKKQDCLLTISGRAEKECVLIEVSDNGVGLAQGETAIKALQEHLDHADEWDYSEYKLSGVALVNIQKRIRARYGKKYGLTIRGGQDAGVTVAVRLPYIKK